MHVMVHFILPLAKKTGRVMKGQGRRGAEERRMGEGYSEPARWLAVIYLKFPLKIICNGTVRWIVCDFILVFYSKYACIFYRFRGVSCI